MNNTLSNILKFLTGKSTAKTVAPKTLAQFTDEARAYYGDTPFQVIIDRKGRFSHAPVEIEKPDARIEAVNQARDEAAAALKAQAEEIIERIRAEKATATLTDAQGTVVPLKPVRKRKPKDGQ